MLGRNLANFGVAMVQEFDQLHSDIKKSVKTRFSSVFEFVNCRNVCGRLTSSSSVGIVGRILCGIGLCAQNGGSGRMRIENVVLVVDPVTRDRALFFVCL